MFNNINYNIWWKLALALYVIFAQLLDYTSLAVSLRGRGGTNRTRARHRDAAHAKAQQAEAAVTTTTTTDDGSAVGFAQKQKQH